MRRISYWVLATASSLVLLFSYRTSTMGVDDEAAVATATGVPAATPAIGATEVDDSWRTPAPVTPSPATPTTAADTGTRTYTGAAAATRWGPVQVRITVSGGRIVSATAVQAPDANGKDRQINAAALPILNSETVQAQSARIDLVSGASVTSQGYVTSLQSAIDQAHL